MKKIIIIDPHDKKYGYLSNHSPYSFTLDGVKWRSVHNYFISKRFGIPPDVSNRADTDYKVTLLTAGKKTCEIDKQYKLTFDTKYKGNAVVDEKSDIDMITKDILTEAITCKFRQNENIANKLIDTKNALIVDRTSECTGKIIMELRDKFLNKNKHSIELAVSDLRDVSFTYGDVVDTFKLVFDIAKRYSDVEGWNIVLPEMVNDAIRTLSPSYVKITSNIKRLINNKTWWDHLHKRMPKFEDILDSCFALLCEENCKYEDDIQIALYILLFIYFLHSNILLSKNEKEKIDKNIKRLLSNGITDSDITIAAEQRWYRTQLPPK